MGISRRIAGDHILYEDHLVGTAGPRSLGPAVFWRHPPGLSLYKQMDHQRWKFLFARLSFFMFDVMIKRDMVARVCYI